MYGRCHLNLSLLRSAGTHLGELRIVNHVALSGYMQLWPDRPYTSASYHHFMDIKNLKPSTYSHKCNQSSHISSPCYNCKFILVLFRFRFILLRFILFCYLFFVLVFNRCFYIYFIFY